MISSIMQQMATDLSITVAVANQSTPPTVMPHVTYEVIKTDFEAPHQKISERTELANDMVEITNYYKVKYTIKLAFINDASDGAALDAIMTMARSSWFWLNEAGRDVCKTYNMVPNIISKEITKTEDDTAATNFQVEFDFVLNGTEESVKQVETITGVDYTYEIKN